MIQKTILIADDDKDLVTALELRCKQLGLEVVTAEDALTALSTVDFVVPDLVCLDVSMPGGNGLAACEMMAGDQRLSSIPVIILTGASDEETIRRCHSMCAYYVLKSRDVWQRVEPLLRELLGIDPAEHDAAETPNQIPAEHAGSAGRRTRRPTILYVEDDRDESNALKIRLESLGADVIQAFNGMEGYRLAVAKEPDLILCDFMMPEGEGDYALRRFQENPVTENIPVIFLTGRQGSDLKHRLYAQGAAAFLTKPVDLEELLHELGRFVKIDKPKQKEVLAV